MSIPLEQVSVKPATKVVRERKGSSAWTDRYTDLSCSRYHALSLHPTEPWLLRPIVECGLPISHSFY